MIEVLSSTSVIIKWETPELLLRNGIITKYHLRVTLASNNTVQSYTVPATVLSVPIEGINKPTCITYTCIVIEDVAPLYTGVQKYSKVSVQIAAETSVGVGPFSDPVSALTDQDCKTHGLSYWLDNACLFYYMLFSFHDSMVYALHEVIIYFLIC